MRYNIDCKEKKELKYIVKWIWNWELVLFLRKPACRQAGLFPALNSEAGPDEQKFLWFISQGAFLLFVILISYESIYEIKYS